MPVDQGYQCFGMGIKHCFNIITLQMPGTQHRRAAWQQAQKPFLQHTVQMRPFKTAVDVIATGKIVQPCQHQGLQLAGLFDGGHQCSPSRVLPQRLASERRVKNKRPRINFAGTKNKHIGNKISGCTRIGIKAQRPHTPVAAGRRYGCIRAQHAFKQVPACFGKAAPPPDLVFQSQQRQLNTQLGFIQGQSAS